MNEVRCFRSLKRFAVAVTIALPLGACQDHHWVDSDKMGEVKMADRPAGAPKEPTVTKGRPGVPYDGAGMLSGSGPSTPAAPPGGMEQAGSFTGVIVAGTVDVDSAVKERAASIKTLYIIARPAAGGPPIAASRIIGPAFPLSFSLTEENVMMAPPQPGQAITVEARLDSDGDPMSKDAVNDLFAVTPGDIVVGDKTVALTLQAASGE